MFMVNNATFKTYQWSLIHSFSRSLHRICCKHIAIIVLHLATRFEPSPTHLGVSCRRSITASIFNGFLDFILTFLLFISEASISLSRWLLIPSVLMKAIWIFASALVIPLICNLLPYTPTISTDPSVPLKFSS